MRVCVCVCVCVCVHACVRVCVRARACVCVRHVAIQHTAIPTAIQQTANLDLVARQHMHAALLHQRKVEGARALEAVHHNEASHVDMHAVLPPLHPGTSVNPAPLV